SSTNYPASSLPPTNAGSYAVTGTVDHANYTGSRSGTLVVARVASAITAAPTAASLTYGQTLAASTLGEGAGTPAGGSFAFVSPTTVPPAGTNLVAVRYTPPDLVNYAASTTSVSVVVGRAPATVTLGALSQTFTGAARVATATTSPVGLGVSFTYDGGTARPTNAGSYAVVGTITNANYTGSASGTLVVSKATATVTLGALGQTYDGSGRAATATTTPAGLPVVFSYSSTNYPASSLPPTNAGSYAVTGTVDHANYTGSKSGTLVVAKASATVTLGSLAQAYDGTPRPATATTTPSGLAVRFTYYVGLSATGAGTTNAPTAIGTYTVVGAVTDTNYQGSGSGTLQITSAPVPAPSVLGDRVPRLRLIGPFADGGVTLEFAASSRQTYRVEASSDLVDWIPVPFQLAPGGASSEWLRSHSPDADRILRVLPRSMGEASGRGLFYRVVGQPGSDR
ncbi:MAG: MBG domain-containing protein, partial [Verrucomicrobiota bacterium]